MALEFGSIASVPNHDQFHFSPHIPKCVLKNTHRNSKSLSLNLYWVPGSFDSFDSFDSLDSLDDGELAKSRSFMIARTVSRSHLQSFDRHPSVLISLLRLVVHIHEHGFPNSLTQHERVSLLGGGR